MPNLVLRQKSVVRMTPFENRRRPFFFRSPHPKLLVCHNFSSNLWVTSQISKAKVFLDSLRRGIRSDFFKNCLQSRATVRFLTPSAHPQKSVLTTESSQNLLAFIKSLYWVFCVVFFYFLCEKHWQRSFCSFLDNSNASRWYLWKFWGNMLWNYSLSR